MPAASFFSRAVGTDPLHKVADLLSLETFGQIDVGDGVLLKTECLVASFTIEMAVLLFLFAVAEIPAEAVFHRSGAVVHLVDEVMFAEDGNGPEYAGLVGVGKSVLDVAEAESVLEA